MSGSVPTRREFLKALGAGAAMFGASRWLPAADDGRERPDIVVILADDMGYSDLGCFGGEISTPNIDRLAERGVRFTSFYNGARCCPSRASLLTGLYAHQAGVGGMTERDLGEEGYRGDLSRACPTIAEVLRPAGYRTYMSGKWHVTRFTALDGPKDNWPCQRGFDGFYGTLVGAGSYFDPTTLVRQNEPEGPPPDGYYYTDAVAGSAAGFIRDHAAARRREPFFLYAAFTAPHWPLQAREEDIRRARGRYDRGWDVLRAARFARMRRAGLLDPRWALPSREPGLPAWADAPDKAWQARRMEVYAAQVESLDRGVGRIVRALEEAGRLERTLLMFLSDNGGCHEELEPSWGDYLLRAPVARARTRDGRSVRFWNDPAVMPGGEDTYQSYGYAWASLSNTPFRRYKHWVHEGGISTPFIVHWPAGLRARGELRRQVGHIIDIMPTCVEAAGAVPPASFGGGRPLPFEGTSLVPAFAGRGLPDRALYWEHEGNRAVRSGPWKLVADGADGPWELYDMDSDRTETSDLAGRRPEEVRRLAGLYGSWAVRAKVVRGRRPG